MSRVRVRVRRCGRDGVRVRVRVRFRVRARIVVRVGVRARVSEGWKGQKDEGTNAANANMLK